MSATLNPEFDAYIAKAAPFAQPILRHLRKLVHAECPAVEEELKWGMPAFMYLGKMLCHMAAFKAHLAFGFWHQDMEKLIAQERGPGQVGEAMGLLGRITRPEDLPNDTTLRRYIKQAIALTDAGTPARPRPAAKKKPEALVPPDLAAGLKRSRKANTTWDDFSSSHRREYVEWITEAKRPATREHRLETTLEWLAEGKSRNWKYANC